LAQAFSADPRHLYLRLNVTYAMNDFIMALKLPPGSEILISDLEYGAIAKICAYKAKIDNLRFRVFPLYKASTDPQSLTADSLTEQLEKSLSPQTKLVMLSHVLTGTGLKLPIEKMAALLRSKNIFFAVDGAHGAGCENLSFKKTELDYYGSNLHKWLMGPKGTGFAWVSPQMREHLEPQFAGWTTGNLPPHFAQVGDGDRWTIRWMICSTHNFSDFYGLPETLRFWKEQGAEKIFSRHQKLRNLMIEKVSDKTGWRCLSTYAPELQGPMIAFELPSHLEKRGPELMKHLYLDKKLVTVTPQIFNRWVLRLSANIYNNEEEIDQMAQILGEIE